ncbi:response regulator transcription factor [Kribbella capetownensis]|uniref:response regulator transcription factor n=1 Tax=Kribbella capetownensis TaxID=1572659 RepID=UPI0013F492FE|nr:response regulator transcription factor [Kribbella capetownensis]
MTVRIVVADDHGIVREGLGALLSAHDGYELVGTAADGAEAVRSAVTLRPDVLVMDIQMPGMSGIDATREIGRVAPDVAVVMLTMFDDDESVFAAMRAGARGYVLKGAAPDNVIRAIAAVAAGEAIFGPGVARRALAYLSGPRPDEPAFAELTPRERDVLNLIAGGLGNAAIAARLGVANATVGNHITSIFAKLQVAGRAEAIIRARSAGLGDPG